MIHAVDDDVDGILCVEAKGTLVVVVGVLLAEREATRACAGGGWEEGRM